MMTDNQRNTRKWLRLLLLIPLIALFWIPSYNYLTPDFAGIPFFYWYQLLWIVIAAGLTAIIYALDA